MAISTVIFDMGGVLIEYDFNATISAIRALSSDPDSAPNRYLDLLTRQDLYTGRIGNPELFKDMVEQLGFQGDRAAFLKAITAGFGGPVAGIEPVVDSLRGSYQISLLSNIHSGHWDYVMSRHALLLNKLTAHFVSHQIGLAKPEGAVFRYVTKGLGVAPADCIFIDDYPPNVARKAGLEAVHFIDSAQLVRELADYGVDASGG